MSEAQQIKARYERRKQLNRDWYSHFSRGDLLIVQERERHVLELLQGHGFSTLEDKRILDVGCGAGGWLRDFLKWGAHPENLHGLDLLEDRVAQAKALSPNIQFLHGNGESLPFVDRAFDLVLQSTVFTSIFDESMRHGIAREMLRVLADDGLILWYDFRYDNPHNPDVLGIGKAEIVRLFPDCQSVFRTITLLPPLARRLGRLTSVLYALLATIPLLRTHYLGFLMKPKSS